VIIVVVIMTVVDDHFNDLKFQANLAFVYSINNRGGEIKIKFSGFFVTL